MGIGIKELLVVLLIILLLFGTKKLKSIGSDLGAAIKGFRKSMSDGQQQDGDTSADMDADTGSPAAKPTDTDKK